MLLEAPLDRTHSGKRCIGAIDVAGLNFGDGHRAWGAAPRNFEQTIWQGLKRRDDQRHAFLPTQKI